MSKNTQTVLLACLGLVCIVSLGLPVSGSTAALPKHMAGSSTRALLVHPGDLPQFGGLATGCGGPAPAAINADYEQRLVELVNTARQQSGVPPLKFTPALVDAARYHAFDLGEDNYFNHDTYDRIDNSLHYICSFDDRILTYYADLNTFISLGENIAAGADTPEEVMSLWMNSPGHRANILSSSYWEFGSGFYNGNGDYGQYWVQDFGRSSGVYPLIINREAATTNEREVTLYIYGNWAEFRLRNDSEPWTDWMPFNQTPNWSLPVSSGMHNVQAEMRTSSSSASAADTIYLQLADPSTSFLFLPMISKP